MGCSPSHSTSSIRVEQQQITELPNSSLFELAEDSSSDTFLQESMKSCTSQLSSKSSSSSSDSGVYELEEDYAHVITENSDPDKVREIDNQFIPPPEDLELVIEGQACPMRVSARNRQLLEQQAILEVLKEEGLIVRSPSKATGGLRFDFVSASLAHKLPPVIRGKQKKKTHFTYEEIQQKLMKAEERRMKMTEEKLNKMSKKDRMDIQTMVQKQAEMNRQKMEKKLQDTAQSRENHIKEMQDRLNARKEHARKVRERKQVFANGFKYILSVENEN